MAANTSTLTPDMHRQAYQRLLCVLGREDVMVVNEATSPFWVTYNDIDEETGALPFRLYEGKLQVSLHKLGGMVEGEWTNVADGTIRRWSE
jgi:hypothetical protein